MARPTLFTNRKFLRLAAILKMPKPHVLGHLEYLWQSGYQSASSVVGDEIDVELVAEWQGEQGALTKALLETGFIDQTELGLEIHDFWTHAPRYVTQRAQTEQRLHESGTTLSEVRRNAGIAGAVAKEAKRKQMGAVCLDNSANSKQNLPLPSLSFPSPPLIEIGVPISPVSSKPTRTRRVVDENYSENFMKWWKAYPRKGRARSGIDKCYPFWKSEHLELRIGLIMLSLERWKETSAWLKDGGQFIPGAHRWLRDGLWKEFSDE